MKLKRFSYTLRIYILLTFFLSIISAPTLLLAQDMEDVVIEDGESDQDDDPEVTSEEVVVTATRTEKIESDSPVPVEVISSTEIEASGARDAGEAINYVAGVFIDDYESAGRGGPGSGVNLHGLPTDRILILIDGQRIPKTMRAPDLEVIPTNIIRRIEVIKGPSSSLYGSDAVGGVINIITRKPTKDISLEGEAGYGHFYTYKTNMLHSTTFGPFGYLLAFNREASDGWIDEYAQKTLVRIGQGVEGWKLVRNHMYHPYDLNDVFGSLTLDIGSRVGWRGQGRFHWEGNGTEDFDGGSVDSKINRLDLQTGFDFDLGKGGDLALTLFGFRHYTRFRQLESVYTYDLIDIDVIDRSYINKGNDTISTNYRAEAIHSVLLGGFSILTTGLDARYETLEYEAFEVSSLTDDDQKYDAFQTVLSAFAQDEFFLFDDRWSLVPGGRLDYHPVWGAVANPKFSTLVKAVKKDVYGLSIRGSVGRAFKEPSLSQLYRKEFRHTGYYLTGNKDLSPEKVVGINGEIEQHFFKRATLKTGYFQYEIEDMIWTDIIQDVYNGFPLMAYVNLKRARTYGLESSLSLTPHNFLNFLNIQLNYTYTRTFDLEEDKELGTVAENQAGGQIFFDLRPWGFGGYLSASYVGQRDYIGMGGLWYTADPMIRTKARLYKSLFDQMEIYIEGENLFNDTYDRDGDSDNDLPPFNLFGGIKFRL